MSNITVIKFNKKVYKKNAIKKSIGLFQDLGDFSFRVVSDSYIVEIINYQGNDADMIKKEFSNYVLYLTSKQ